MIQMQTHILIGLAGVALGVVLSLGTTHIGQTRATEQPDISAPVEIDLAAAAMTEICTTDDVYGSGGMDDSHQHPVRNVVAADNAPSLTHLVFPDAVGGYNIQILTQNFEFTPASINREVEDNAGHAHIYVNGEKIARVYSNWYHLPANALSEGVNVVSVTLNANDHSEWAIDDEVISSSVKVMRPAS